jgi:hypothetical protein
MKKFRYFLIILTVMFLYCSEKSNPINSDIDYIYFTAHWVNSFEEQIENDPTKIYRPSNYMEFPPSRYREQLTFNQDGSCRYLVLSPLDRHYFITGKWDFLNKKENIIQISDSLDETYKKFQILELDQNLLKFVTVN